MDPRAVRRQRCCLRVVFTAALVGVGVALALPVGAQPGGDAPGPATADSAPVGRGTAVVILVEDVAADGVREPAAGVDVSLDVMQTPPPARPGLRSDEPPRVVQTVEVRTDERGRARAVVPAVAEQVVARWREPGGEARLEREVATLQRRPELRLFRYAAEGSAVDVQAAVECRLEVRDGRLDAMIEMHLTVPRPVAVRWAADAPFAIPMLAPLVRDADLSAGLLSVAGRGLQWRVQGPVEVVRERGMLGLVGALAPERDVRLRVAYGIPFDGPELALGFRGAVGETTLAAAVSGLPPTRVALRSPASTTVIRAEQGGRRVTALRTLAPLRHGEQLPIIVEDLPAPAHWPRRALLGVAFGVVLLVVAGARELRHRG